MKIGSHLAKGKRLSSLLHDKLRPLELKIKAIIHDLANIY
jgi:hypothetical protein